MMKFAQNEVRQITEDAWKIILGEELEPPGRELRFGYASDGIAACAQITGDWQLAVALYCSARIARHAAGVMFNRSEGDIGAEEVNDAMCELINIISGNIKGILSGMSQLSLPNLVEGTDFRLLFPRHVVLSEASFIYRGEPLWVMLLGEDHTTVRSESNPAPARR